MSPLEHIATPLLICYSFVSAYTLCCKVGLLIDKESVQCFDHLDEECYSKLTPVRP
jgi:hypothetical protein